MLFRASVIGQRYLLCPYCLVLQFFEKVEESGLESEGIFRLSGCTAKVKVSRVFSPHQRSKLSRLSSNETRNPGFVVHVIYVFDAGTDLCLVVYICSMNFVN